MSFFLTNRIQSSLLLGVLLLVSHTANAVTFDASSSAIAANTNTLTFSHQVGSGSNKKLLVGIGIEEPSTTGSEVVTSVTYNGVALTRVRAQNVVSNNYLQNVEVWYLDNPPNGSHNVIITTTGTVDNLSAGAISLFDAQTGSPVSTTSTKTASTSIATSITTTAANTWLVDFVGGGDQRSYTQSTTQGSNQTERWDRTNASSSFAASTLIMASTGTATITETANASTNRLAHIVLAVKPYSAGGGGGSCVIFKDLFTNVNYNNSDGDADWTGDSWQERIDGGSPSTGSIRITGGELQLSGTGGTTNSVKRHIDLSSYDTATLSFNYRTSGTWEGNDHTYVYADVSNTNSGTLLYNFANDNASATYTKDITSYISSNFYLRFLEGANQSNELAHFDNVQIEACKTADTTPPTITSVTGSCPGLNKVTVIFSENVDTASATNISNYALDNGATVTGASLSGNTVTLTTSALTDLTSYTLTVNNVKDLAGNAIAANSTSTFAVNCSNLVAQYRFDEETWNGTSGEVKDTLGAHNGTAVGVASPLYPGKVCNAAYIPYDNNNAAQYAVDTGIDVNSIGSNGNSGSIDFWYQSDTPWQGGGDRVLFDASNISTSPNKYFYLVIQNNGRLLFGLEDSNDSDFRFTSPQYNFTASDWVHIGVTWDLPNDRLEIYVNGNLVATNTSNTNGVLGDMNTLYIGDNRTTYHPNGTANSASGRIDEFYIYKTVITQSQMQTDMNATHACTTVACSYRDDFTTASFANNDGSLTWAGNWTEYDTASAGVGAGYVSISGGSLVLQNNTPSETNNRPGVVRGFSLNGATDATLSYTYKLTGGVDNVDQAIVQVSDDGGTSWTTVDTINNKTDGVYTNKVSLSSFPGLTLTNNMQVAIRINDEITVGNTACCYGGSGETISFLYFSIYPAGMCGVSSLDHIRIEHDGEGLTCDGEQVKIRACADTNCTAEYTGSVTTTLTPDGDTVTFTGNTGTTAVKVRKSVAGTATLGATGSSPVPTNGVRCFNGATETCTMNFVDSGFRFTDGANPPNPITIGTQIAGKASNINPGLQTIALQAVRTDTNTGTCVGVFADTKDVNVELASQCNNPTTCIAASKVSVVNNSITTPINNNPNTGVSSYTSVPLRFTTNSQAILNFTYPDVGQIKLFARYNIPDKSGVATGNYMSGNSNAFVVKPGTFVVTNIKRTSDSFVNPQNSAPTDTPFFIKAGDNFTVTVEARDFSGTNVTPNYGNETDPEGILLTPSLVTGLGLTNNPALANNTLSGLEFGSTGAVNDADGLATVTNLSWPEVGIIKITPSVTGTDGNNYLLAGAVTGTASVNIGRFVPHHFDTTVTQGCGTFTYSGQPFTVAATAMNLASTPTQNYTGAFAFDTTLSNGAVSPIINFNSTNVIPKANFTNGTASKTDVAYTFPAKDTIPDTITLRANDADTVNAVGVTEGTAEIRSGRMRLENAYGSELTALSMPVKIEYYSDNTLIGDTSDDGFVLNTNDSCTSYDATAAPLYNYTGNLSAGNTTVSGAGTIAAGLGTITFSAPGSGNEGSVILLANNVSPWLTYSWNVDCDNADGDNDITTGIDAGLCGPFGLASFGLYRGDDRVIYWKEVF